MEQRKVEVWKKEDVFKEISVFEWVELMVSTDLG